MLTQDSEQDIVVDGGEEFLHVAFEYPDSPGMIMGHLPGKFLKSIKRLVNPLSVPTGKRIGDEQSIKERVQDTIHGPVYHPVPHARLVDIPRLRIRDAEGFVAGVVIGACGEVIVQGDNIVHQVPFKDLHITPVPFSDSELFPRKQKALEGYDRIVIMNTSAFHTSKNTPPRLLPVLQKLKEAYILWFDSYRILPKTHRYSLGKRIDDLFVASIEAVSQAGFLSSEKKLPYVQYAIRKVDTIKVFLMILWETKSLDDKKYLALSLRLDEIGRMLGGWSGQIVKQNSPDRQSGEK